MLTVAPDPAAIKAHAPAGTDDAMIEGNLGLQWGMNEYRYGPNKAALAEKLKALTAKRISEAVRAHLANDTRAVCRISPAE
jgi:hypothetical protein